MPLSQPLPPSTPPSSIVASDFIPPILSVLPPHPSSSCNNPPGRSPFTTHSSTATDTTDTTDATDTTTNANTDTDTDTNTHSVSIPMSASHPLSPCPCPPPAPSLKQTLFPASPSLDSMSSVYHLSTAQNLLQLEVSHPDTRSSVTYHRRNRSQYLFQHVCSTHSNFNPNPNSIPHLSFQYALNPIQPSLSHPHTLNLGTKSPYPVPNPIPPLPYLSNNPHSPRLVHVSLVARHGTRNPTNNCLIRLASLQHWLKSQLTCQPPWLHAWSKVLERYRQDPGSLTLEGVQELRGIGSRFAQLYAVHLKHVGGTVRLRSSYKARAVSSATSFLGGYLDACAKFHLPSPITLLDNENPSDSSDSVTPSDTDSSDTDPSDLDLSDDSDPDPTNPTNLPIETSSVSSSEDDLTVEILPDGHDAVLRYFERNAEYATFAVQHKALTRRFLSTGPLQEYAKEMAERISRGLGASSTMDIDLVRSVSDACAFDSAHGRSATSMFCSVLTPRDTAVLELFERQHRPFFKGHERFRAVAAPLVADLAQSLRASVKVGSSSSTQAADLRFAHAETLVPLLLLLGIRTNGLDVDHPEFQQGLHAMSPFAANLAIELYEEDDQSEGKRHFVRFRLHERYVECIPALEEHGANGEVDLKHLLAFFDKILEEGKRFYQ